MSFIYEIRTKLSITYSLLLFLLSISSIATSLVLLYQTITSIALIPKEWTLSITILFVQSIFSFFNSLLTLAMIIRGIIETCYSFYRRPQEDIFVM